MLSCSCAEFDFDLGIPPNTRFNHVRRWLSHIHSSGRHVLTGRRAFSALWTEKEASPPSAESGRVAKTLAWCSTSASRFLQKLTLCGLGRIRRAARIGTGVWPRLIRSSPLPPLPPDDGHPQTNVHRRLRPQIQWFPQGDAWWRARGLELGVEALANHLARPVRLPSAWNHNNEDSGLRHRWLFSRLGSCRGDQKIDKALWTGTSETRDAARDPGPMDGWGIAASNRVSVAKPERAGLKEPLGYKDTADDSSGVLSLWWPPSCVVKPQCFPGSLARRFVGDGIDGSCRSRFAAIHGLVDCHAPSQGMNASHNTRNPIHALYSGREARLSPGQDVDDALDAGIPS